MDIAMPRSQVVFQLNRDRTEAQHRLHDPPIAHFHSKSLVERTLFVIPHFEQVQ